MSDQTRHLDPLAPTAGGPELDERLSRKLKIRIPGYELLDEIDRGGQATVYRARELTSGLTVAIKLLHAGPYADASARQRLAREIAALKSLNHPNIVCVIDAGQTEDGLDYLVMNYVSGTRLDDLWKRHRGAPAPAESDPAALLRLFKTICDVVNVAHLKGIVHRDLSPSNILVDSAGQPHVLDFGLASTAFDSYITPGARNLSITGQFLGKLAYASPEQARGDRKRVDVRTDVYALGVILYQILTGGAFPYEVMGDFVEVINHIIHSKPTPPSEMLARQDERTIAAANRKPVRRVTPPLVNPTIEAVVLKALEKEPQNRYQSAGELAADIDNYLAGRPTRALPTVQPDHSRTRRRLIGASIVTGTVLITGVIMNLGKILGWVGLTSLAAMLGAGPATKPSTQPVGAPGRIEFKTIELASVDTSLLAIHRALLNANYRGSVASAQVDDATKGVEWMDRNGGAPVSWRAFYGKTVKDFSSRNIFGDRQVYDRPPQFDYIYRANNEKKRRVEQDIAALGKEREKLFDRRRAMERKQVVLWATIAWEMVSDCGIDLEPLYRFNFKDAEAPVADAQVSAAKARRSVARLAITFLQTVDASLRDGLQQMDGSDPDPTKVLVGVGEDVKAAYSSFRLAGNDAVLELPPPEQQRVREMLDCAKHLYDLTRNAVDANNSAADRDAAGDEPERVRLRAELQRALVDSCAATYQFDLQARALASAWHLEVDRNTPAPAVARHPRVAEPMAPKSDATATPPDARAPEPRGDSDARRSGARIDLLRLIDLSKDAMAGSKWTAQGHSLSGGGGSRIEFPYVPPREYDLEIAFVRLSGKWNVSTIGVTNGRQFRWVIGANSNMACGFDTIGGRASTDRSNPTRKENAAGWIKNGERCVSLMKVRAGLIEGYVDGKLISSWKTDGSDLSIGARYALHQNDRLGFDSSNPVVIESAVLTDVSGDGRPAR